MDASTLLDYYQNARRERIVLSFMGIVTQEIMVEYGKLIQQQEGLSLNSRQILFGTFIELAQNIIRYSAERVTTAGQLRGVGLVLVSEQDDTFTVSSGNLVTCDTADELQRQLSALVVLGPDELKQLARDRRRSGPPAGSKGAGLGLIEIVRRAAKPPRFEFATVGDNRFFSLSVKIAKGIVP
jgi:hypothetical protein